VPALARACTRIACGRCANRAERLRASRNEAACSPMPVEPRAPNMADMEPNEMFRSNPAAGCGSIARFE
jgi:hypothetical protein